MTDTKIIYTLTDEAPALATYSLLPLVQGGKLRPARIITHTMALGDAPKGYAIFDRKEDQAIKVMLKP